MREELGIASVILSAIGRPTDNLPTGKWRWLMATDFEEEAYGQRWQVETVMFMLKSHQGEALTARSNPARDAEMGLMAVTHNLMILAIEELFYRADGAHYRTRAVRHNRSSDFGEGSNRSGDGRDARFRLSYVIGRIRRDGAIGGAPSC